MKQPRQQPQPNRAGKAMGCGCLGILALLVVGLIGSSIDSGTDTDSHSAKASPCPTMKLTGLPTEHQQVNLAAGKATCDDDTTVIPFTATSTADHAVAVTMTLRLTAPDGGHEQEPVFIRQDLAAGGTVHSTINVRPWGHIDGATKLTATVTEFTVGKPDPDPTGDTNMHGPDLHRPHRCHHKWYC